MGNDRDSNAEPVEKKKDSTENEGRWTKLDSWLCALHLFTLCSLALAKPLYDVTAKDAAFYVVRGSRPVDIISLILILSVVIPAILALVEWLLGLVNRRLRLFVHYLFIFILASLYGALFLKHAKMIDGFPAVALITALGALGAILYARTESCRRLVSLASPIIVLFPLIFVFGSQVGKIVKPQWLAKKAQQDKAARHLDHKKKPPIVFVLMDELPVVSLLDAQGNIDARRFPNLAGFAKTATWYRNATAVSAQTTTAVPAILTGVFPTKVLLPNLADHPDNLFTLLGNDYNCNIYESATQLCPEGLASDYKESYSYAARFSSLLSDLSILYFHIVLPPAYTQQLPSINNKWQGFATQNQASIPAKADTSNVIPSEDDVDKQIISIKKGNRTATFRTFISRIKATEPDSLHFFHIMLPHGPFEYLPSCKRYQMISELGFEGMSKIDDRYVGPQGLVDKYHQAHILQLACLDNLLGELITHLKKTELFDESLIVFVADHGASFITNDFNRRLSDTNVADLMFVPLLIKTPQQHEGKTLDAVANTIDVLPTITDVLGFKIPWKTSGNSLLAPLQADIPSKSFLSEAGSVHSYPYSRLLADRDKTHRRNIELFELNNENSTVYWYGKYRALMGRPVKDFEVRNGDFSVKLDQQTLYESVDIKSNFSPSFINGKISGATKSPPLIAISVNGVIQAVTETYTNNNDYLFSEIIPDLAFIQGSNDLDFFVVSSNVNGQYYLSSVNINTQTYVLSNDEITSSDSKKYRITSNSPLGLVDEISTVGNTFIIEGWSTNRNRTHPAEFVVVFADEQYVATGRSTRPRSDVAKLFNNQNLSVSGFRFRMPSKSIPDLSKMRAFSISGSEATELAYDKRLGLTADYAKRLHSNGKGYSLSGNSIVSSQAESLHLVPGALQGSIDILEQKEMGTILTGWAANAKQGQPVDSLMVFADRVFLGSGKTLVSRPDVGKALKKPKLAALGFNFLLPPGSVNDLSRIRIFAVYQGVASELINPLYKPPEAGPATGMLDDRTAYTLGADRIVAATGETLMIDSQSLQGSLDGRARTGERVTLAGWAADVQQSRPADGLLIFANGRFVAYGRLNTTRSDVSKAHHNKNLKYSGFEYHLPANRFDDMNSIRVFAVGKGTATELPYGGAAGSSAGRGIQKK